jgi:predicted 3-demethylubiquinone-9 3-methyltransferase (glyoxalase superfamily)
MVKCESQQEIDEMWAKLSAGGEEGPCGWLKDKYGLSWQIVASGMDSMLNDPDDAKSERVMEAILRMGKLDLARLKHAFEGQ